MRKIYIICYTLVLSNIALGQEGMPNIVPPSPEAASVFKFTEVPVSLHTGLANINVPLFEIESGGITVPINISYHSRGVLIDEIASRVGLGWSLNYGGMISRQVRGRVDGNYNGWTLSNIYNDYFTSTEKRVAVGAALLLNDIPGGELDLIPDKYFFNANGISGNFTWDYTDGEVLMQNYSNIKIISLPENTIALIDGKGNTYYFVGMDYDMTLQNYAAQESGGYIPPNNGGGSIGPINTWHLTKIRTQTGSEILYLYEDGYEITNYYRRSYDKFDHESFPKEYKCYFSYNSSYQKRIKQILFDKGKLEFTYKSSEREDLEGGNVLENITLTDKVGNIIKNVHFDYEYTTAIDDGNVNYYLNNIENQPRAKKRLFLKRLQFGVSGFLQTYHFEYDNQVLPSRHSNSQDAWGYFNGKNNGQFLKRQYEMAATAGRAVDTLKSSAGLLKKIIKPEGGSVNFHYENNIVKNNLPNYVVFSSSNPIQPENFTLSPLNHIDFDSIRVQPVFTYDDKTFRKAFTITDRFVGRLKYKISMSDENCTTSNYTSCQFYVNIHRMSDNSIVASLAVTPNNQYIEIPFQPGNYIMTVKAKDPNYDPALVMDSSFMVQLQWSEESIENGFIYGAGKRIRKIEYKDPLNNIELCKTYDYNSPASGQSTGILLGLANYYSLNTPFILHGGNYATESYGCIPGSPVSSYQGNTLGYSFVTEYYGDGINNTGKTEYNYSNYPNTGTVYKYPYHPPVDNEWLRGKELSVTHYKKTETGAYLPVKKIDNEYLFGDYISPVVFNPKSYRRTLQGLYVENVSDFDFPQNVGYDNSEGQPYYKSKRMFRLPLAHPYRNQWISDDNDPYLRCFKGYYLTGGTVDLLKTETTDYFENGNELVTTVQYGYDYDRHYSVASTQQTTSDGNIFSNRYKYAQSMEMQNDSISSILIAKNMVDIVLHKETRRNLPEKLSAEVTKYKDWGDGLIAPEIIQTSKGLNNLENRIRYNQYDFYGNPLEVQQENGTPISYIWGYNHTQPVAKIENIAYNSIPLNLITAIHDATTESAMLSALTALRNHSALANAMVSTYTYIPLVGVKTMTDPKGYTMTYHYDNFNRLWKVTDMQGNILSENQYHYRTQN